MRFFLLLFCVLSLRAAETPPAQPTPPVPFVYPILEHRVVDGDTISASIDLGFDLRYSASIRLHGLNTPEVTGVERDAGLVVSERVRQWLAQHDRVYVRSVAKDKYAGRFVGVIIAPDGTTLNDWLLQQNLAIPYDGAGPVPRFTAEQLQAIIGE